MSFGILVVRDERPCGARHVAKQSSLGSTRAHAMYFKSLQNKSWTRLLNHPQLSRFYSGPYGSLLCPQSCLPPPITNSSLFDTNFRDNETITRQHVSGSTNCKRSNGLLEPQKGHRRSHHGSQRKEEGKRKSKKTDYHAQATTCSKSYPAERDRYNACTKAGQTWKAKEMKAADFGTAWVDQVNQANHFQQEYAKTARMPQARARWPCHKSSRPTIRQLWDAFMATSQGGNPSRAQVGDSRHVAQ